jgi:hypothetical protein
MHTNNNSVKSKISSSHLPPQDNNKGKNHDKYHSNHHWADKVVDEPQKMGSTRKAMGENKEKVTKDSMYDIVFHGNYGVKRMEERQEYFPHAATNAPFANFYNSG